MTRGSNRKSGLKKPYTKITRRILVAALEQERRPMLEQVRQMVRQAVDEAPQTAQALRRDHGISLPTLSPEWDLVPTAEPNPSQTIEAFDGERSEIRITLHLDSLVDNTTTMQLEGLGISHLIGISIGGLNHATWQTSGTGGMIALINSPVTTLPSLLHDILLDMAMVHAKSQSWSGIRDQLSSYTIATLKEEFVREKDLLGIFPYGSISECRYFPLAAFARVRPLRNAKCWHGLDLMKYVELWIDFAVFAKERANLKLHAERENLSGQILESHLNARQISPARLTKKIAQLTPGHYCLYFLIRKADKQAKVAELSAFFHTSKSKFRTQRFIIHPRDKHAKQAAVFLAERYISVFPFYVGEK